MQNLAVVPVLNKVDMEAAQPDTVAEQVHQVNMAAGAIAHAPLGEGGTLLQLAWYCSDIKAEQTPHVGHLHASCQVHALLWIGWQRVSLSPQKQQSQPLTCTLSSTQHSSSSQNQVSACCPLWLSCSSIRSALQSALQVFDLQPSSCLQVSAKTGFGLETVLPAVIERIPHPAGDPDGPLRMLLFDAYHDEYRSAKSATFLLELDLAAPVGQTSKSTCAGCTAKLKSAGPLQQPSPCLAQACTLSMLLLWAECNTCQALQPANYWSLPTSACQAPQQFAGLHTGLSSTPLNLCAGE